MCKINNKNYKRGYNDGKNEFEELLQVAYLQQTMNEEQLELTEVELGETKAKLNETKAKLQNVENNVSILRKGVEKQAANLLAISEALETENRDYEINKSKDEAAIDYIAKRFGGALNMSEVRADTAKFEKEHNNTVETLTSQLLGAVKDFSSRILEHNVYGEYDAEDFDLERELFLK